MTLIIIAVVLFWGYNYYRFHDKYTYFKLMAGYLQALSEQSSDYKIKLRLSSALIQIQHYKDAYELLKEVKDMDIIVSEGNMINLNMDFCQHPLPGVNTLKNYHHDYWHHFFLFRFGRSRFNFLTDEDYLPTNSLRRNHL